MMRRSVLLGIFAILLLADFAYFGRRCAVSLMRWQGERAFHAGRYARALRLYETALHLGPADRRTVTTDIAEFLVFSLGQSEIGTTHILPLPPAVLLERATEVVQDLVVRAPQMAYTWSLASDLSFHLAHERRRVAAIDLSGLSEEPLENLVLEERLGLAELDLAARLEPNNYLYHDLLVEKYLELGSPGAAAPHVRRGVAALPDFDDHLYLMRRDLPAELLEAALLGFEDARGRPSLVSPAVAALDAARLLIHHNRHAEARPLIQAALREAPRSFLAHYLAGQAAWHLNDTPTATEHFAAAARLAPLDPWVQYSLGLTLLAGGAREAAITALTRARELNPAEIRFFHRLGGILEEAGRIREAERQFVAAANLNTGEVGAWAELLAFYERRGDTAAVADTCERAHAFHPDWDSGASRCLRTTDETP